MDSSALPPDLAASLNLHGITAPTWRRIDAREASSQSFETSCRVCNRIPQADGDSHTWHFLTLHEVRSNDSNDRYFVGTCGNCGAGQWMRYRLEKVGDAPESAEADDEQPASLSGAAGFFRGGGRGCVAAGGMVLASQREAGTPPAPASYTRCTMKRLYLLGLVLPVLFAGCGHGSRSISVRSSYEADDGVDEVYYEEDVVYVDDDEEDVNYVVYREYFLCTDEEIATIPYYRRYYQVDDDDLFFLFTVSRHTGRPIDVVIRSYHYECDRDYDRVIQTYHVDRDVFFVDVGGTISFEGPVERPYRAWRGRNHHRERFSRDEYRALVTMKIGVEFGDRRPEQVARDIRQYQAAPRRAIYNDRERLGHGGRNVRGGKVTQEAPRVWTMDRERRQEVHVQRKRHAEELRPKFEREHNQRVKEVRQKDGRIRRPENRPEQQKIRPKDEPRRPEEDQRRKKPRNR